MNTPEENELDARLRKADPAKSKVVPNLPDGILANAAAENTKLTLAEKIQALGARAKLLLAGGALTASAATVAVAMVVALTPAPLIQLAANQGANAEASGMSQDASKMWMPYQIFEYLAADDLSNDRGRGEVYKLVREGNPEEVLTKIAAIMGVSGSIKKYPDFNEDFPGYFFGASNDPWGYDSVNPVVSLWWSGTGSWNYSNPTAYPESKCEESDKDGNCERWTEFKPTPELLPSRAEAVAKALEIFNATGLNVTESDLRVYIDDWGVNVSSSLKVDGQDTSVEWYLGWSSNGTLSYAGGHSVRVESMGTFDTIGAKDAVKRLDDWRWGGAPSPSYYEKFQSYYSGAQVRSNEMTEGGVSGDSGSSGGGDVEPVAPDATAKPIDPDMTDEPMPVEPMEPELVQITIVEAESTLLTIWDQNGDVWLVPGYIMINDQGWFSAVISLIEGVIALPKETEFDIMPMPADDMPVTNEDSPVGDK
jgi:hypothetical protein